MEGEGECVAMTSRWCLKCARNRLHLASLAERNEEEPGLVEGGS